MLIPNDQAGLMCKLAEGVREDALKALQGLETHP